MQFSANQSKSDVNTEPNAMSVAHLFALRHMHRDSHVQNFVGVFYIHNLHAHLRTMAKFSSKENIIIVSLIAFCVCVWVCKQTKLPKFMRRLKLVAKHWRMLNEIKQMHREKLCIQNGVSKTMDNVNTGYEYDIVCFSFTLVFSSSSSSSYFSFALFFQRKKLMTCKFMNMNLVRF